MIILIIWINIVSYKKRIVLPYARFLAWILFIFVDIYILFLFHFILFFIIFIIPFLFINFGTSGIMCLLLFLHYLLIEKNMLQNYMELHNIVETFSNWKRYETFSNFLVFWICGTRRFRRWIYSYMKIIELFFVLNYSSVIKVVEALILSGNCSNHTKIFWRLLNIFKLSYLKTVSIRAVAYT